MKVKNVQINIPLDVIKLMVSQLSQDEKQEVVEVLVENKRPSKRVKKKEKLQFKGFLRGMKVNEEDFEQVEKELFKHAV